MENDKDYMSTMKLSTPSKWQQAYHRYRELDKEFAESRGREKLAILLHDAIQNTMTFNNTLHQYKNLPTAPQPSGDLIEELKYFSKLTLHSKSIIRYAGSIYEDVYHLAFDRLNVGWPGNVHPAPQRPLHQLHRGQRDYTWDVGPKIYRGLPGNENRQEILHEKAMDACRISQAIASELNCSFNDAMAITQHYSELLDVSTWLVDFSENPWVALFFASDGGRTGEIGIVWSIFPSEYSSYAVGPIGPIESVVPEGVQRIKNQNGVFLNSIHPSLFSQYVAPGRESCFKQYDGLIFEDELLGITRNNIYPPADPLIPQLKKIRNNTLDRSYDAYDQQYSVPPDLFSEPDDPHTYEKILIQWSKRWKKQRELDMRGEKIPFNYESAHIRTALFDLCRFHALLQSPDYINDIDIVGRSLSKLRSAMERLLNQALESEPLSVRAVVEHGYIRQAYPSDVLVLKRALNQIAPQNEPSGSSNEFPISLTGVRRGRFCAKR